MLKIHRGLLGPNLTVANHDHPGHPGWCILKGTYRSVQAPESYLQHADGLSNHTSAGDMAFIVHSFLSTGSFSGDVMTGPRVRTSNLLTSQMGPQSCYAPRKAETPTSLKMEHQPRCAK
ncbi:uncharacterized protein LOC144681396 [Cetorhinus maximus]